MKITLLAIGKTDDKYLQEGIKKYIERLKHYTSFEFKIIPDIKNTKNMDSETQKKKEGELILKNIQGVDSVFLLDEGGKEFSSRGFASFVEKLELSSTKQLYFIIGGPYGFSKEVINKSRGKISLSKMTFSHQMVRLIFTEQLYRAFAIINKLPYHHD